MQVFERLEKEWGEYVGMDHVVGCSSGTAALHLAIEALKLPLGSRVGVPSLSMIAVPRAVVLAGHIPVPIPCRDDLNIDPTSIPRDVDALVVVHTYGRRCDMDAVFSYTSVLVIEDLAEAHTIMPDRRSFAACWSFYQNKIVAGEEGGAVGFNKEVHESSITLCRSLRCLGFTEDHDFWHRPRGHNYRLSNSHAQLILDSLHDIEWNVDTRNRLIEICDTLVDDDLKMPVRQSPWVYDVKTPWVKTWEGQTQLVKQLQTLIPGVRHCFKPVWVQEEFNFLITDTIPSLTYSKDQAVNDCRRSQQTIYLPLYPTQINQSSYLGNLRKSFELLSSLR